jgi:hypothetical protein
MRSHSGLNDTTLDPPLLSFYNTFKEEVLRHFILQYCSSFVKPVVLKEETLEMNEMVEVLNDLDTVVLEPDALEASVLLQVLYLFETLQSQTGPLTMAFCQKYMFLFCKKEFLIKPVISQIDKGLNKNYLQNSFSISRKY